MSNLAYSNGFLLKVLHSVQTIAMIGASTRWNRPSYFAMKYLQEKGYRVIPINPTAAGASILGEACYASLASVPGSVDMVDIFRNSEAAGAVVDETIALKDLKGIRIVWMQLGVCNEEAAARAKAADLTVVMDRCPKIEFGRLHAELARGGFNTGIITSKRPRQTPAR